MNEQLKIIRLPDVEQRSGISRSTIYRYMNAGNFPKTIKIGLRAVGWLESDIDAWIRSVAKQSAV
jgi:prophage regulatory protein